MLESKVSGCATLVYDKELAKVLGEIVCARNPQLVSHSHLDWAESPLCLILTRCNWITK